jgi:UDP-glucose 4-epimerase
MPAERCLVVGGGLIGSRTANELASRGHPVKLLSRSFNPWLEQRGEDAPTIELVRGTIPGAPEAAELIAEADLVFFMAGESTPKLADDAAANSIAGLLVPALEVLDQMLRAGKKRVVLASSGGTVYGRPETLPTPEDAPTRPISVHGVNSVATEQYALFYARQHGLEPSIVRFSNVYGPGQYARRGLGVVAAWCEALAAGDPVVIMGDGEVRRDFIYADDAARAAVAAAFDAPRPGVYNAGSGVSTSLRELLELIAEASGQDPRLDRRAAREIDVPVTQLDSSALEGHTGWTPEVGLVEGVARTWEWAHRHGAG